MTFDEVIEKAANALDKAEGEADSGRAGTLLTAANTWVRIAELIRHRDADNNG